MFRGQKGRMVSHKIEINEEDLIPEDGHTSEAIIDLVKKLSAEDSRLRRLLPPAPEGYFWELSIERADNVLNNKVDFRAVYALRKTL